MYTRDSRYRRVEEVTRTDTAGRELLVTDLRRRQRRAGSLMHTVEVGDRLDHLGHRYYRRPDAWWRIGDANPEFLSPLALLGDDPLRTARVVVPVDGDPPAAWSVALRALAGTAGVERASFALEPRGPDGSDLTAGVITVSFNALTVSIENLLAIVADVGFAPGPVERVGRVGKAIVVPPAGPA